MRKAIELIECHLPPKLRREAQRGARLRHEAHQQPSELPKLARLLVLRLGEARLGVEVRPTAAGRGAFG